MIGPVAIVAISHEQSLLLGHKAAVCRPSRTSTGTVAGLRHAARQFTSGFRKQNFIDNVDDAI